jgi:hypothetical protein
MNQEEDRTYWEHLVRNTSYTLYGWTGKLHASFRNQFGEIVQLTKEHVNLIDAIIEAREDNDYGKYIDSRHGR